MIGIQLKIMEFDFPNVKNWIFNLPIETHGYGYLTFISHKTHRENFLCLQATANYEFEIKSQYYINFCLMRWKRGKMAHDLNVLFDSGEKLLRNWRGLYVSELSTVRTTSCSVDKTASTPSHHSSCSQL